MFFLKWNYQEADLAAGPLTVTEERSAVVAFTDPFLEFRYTAIIKKPRKRKMRIRTAEQLLDSDLPYGVEEGSISQVEICSLILYGNFTFDLYFLPQSKSTMYILYVQYE